MWIATGTWTPTDTAMSALCSGTLDLENSAVVVRRGSRVIDLIWPAGYTAQTQPNGSPAISRSDGVTVHHIGDHVRLGGGYVDADSIVMQVRGGHGDIFAVQCLLPRTAPRNG